MHSLSDRWHLLLGDLRATGEYRELALPRGVDFCSNDYLGLGSAVPPACPELSRSGLGSRLLGGQHAIWEQVETALARWHGAEAATIFTSGYAANEGLLSAIIEPHDWVASDERNHASLIDGIRLSRAEKFVFRHNDVDHLEDGLRHASRGRVATRQLFVVTESLFGMDGDLSPLAGLAELAVRYQAHLIVDEAHATGCFGPGGAGLVAAAGLRSRVCASVHTGGKALGVPGAYVVGSSVLKDLLVNRCRHFLFTTALPAAVGTWWLTALAQVRAADQAREALQAGAALFRAELARHGIHSPGSEYIVPVILGDNSRAVAAARQLQGRGWDIRAIRPPSVPAGTARLRIGIHADHDHGLLRDVAAVVAAVSKREPVP